MSKRKAAENCNIRPWLSAKRDNKEGRFIQVGNSLFLSKAFNELTPGAQMLYLRLAIESGGRSSTVFTHGTAKKHGIAPTSYKRYASELEDAGFIERVPCLEQFAPAEYKFSPAWKQKSRPNLDRVNP